MKLATLTDGTRDGTLVVVSRDLTRYAPAADIAATMQAALENWDTAEEQLKKRFNQLQAGAAQNAAPFDAALVRAPLPRAYAWLDASVFANHGRLMAKAMNIAVDRVPASYIRMYQGGSDTFLGPTDDIVVVSEDHGIDFEMEVGVIVGDVPMAVTPAEAARAIKLVILLNDVSLRAFAPTEVKAGFGFVTGKPSTSFAPVAVTPDELGVAWRDERLHLPVRVSWNGTPFGWPDAGDMQHSFADLVARAAQTRRLTAGTIVGSGTVSSPAYEEVGSGCIQERRAIETIATGAPVTPFMHFGDRVHIEVLDEKGRSIFGSIDQRVVEYHPQRNN